MGSLGAVRDRPGSEGQCLGAGFGSASAKNPSLLFLGSIVIAVDEGGLWEAWYFFLVIKNFMPVFVPLFLLGCSCILHPSTIHLLLQQGQSGCALTLFAPPLLLAEPSTRSRQYASLSACVVMLDYVRPCPCSAHTSPCLTRHVNQ